VDIRLLSLVAEVGRAAVHELAARLGMDPREVAARLVALSATGLPLIVGVECDQNGLRSAVAGAMNYAAQQNGPGVAGMPSGAYPVQGMPSGPYPAPNAPAPGQYPVPGNTSGPYPAAGTTPAPYPVPGGNSGPYPPQQWGGPSGSYPVPQNAMPVRQQAAAQAQSAAADPMSTWGPPQTASWARGDQPPRLSQPAAAGGARVGKVGDRLQTEGLDGEQIVIQLVEVVDPADFLFTAAGYRLREGERAVVVHTELTNRGSIPFPTLPDLYLVLIDGDGKAVGKAPVSLSSRPPHRIGVQPGETAGGHTVYVISDTTPITSVRWSARSDDDKHVLTWSVDN
jgi:hypothetical protein